MNSRGVKMVEKKRGRKPREFDEDEVREIINSMLAELNGNKSKLNYHGVWKHNIELANNPTTYKRENGMSFKLYGYDFGAGSYPDKDSESGERIPYFGKKKIDEIKSTSTVIIAGEEFIFNMQDLKTLVEDWYSKPAELSRRLCKLFETDRNKIKHLEDESAQHLKKIHELETRLEMFEKGFSSLFLNSALPYNSLENVMSITKSKDDKVRDDLKNMFSGESNLNRILKGMKSSSTPQEKKENVINILETKDARKKRRDKLDDGL